jgi:hypothetical protein
MHFQDWFYMGALLCFVYIVFVYSKIYILIHREHRRLASDSHIALDINDFYTLVSGGILDIYNTKNSAKIKIILKDIGYHHMDAQLTKAEISKERTDRVKIIGN